MLLLNLEIKLINNRSVRQGVCLIQRMAQLQHLHVLAELLKQEDASDIDEHSKGTLGAIHARH